MSDMSSKDTRTDGRRFAHETVESLERLGRDARDELKRDVKAPSTRAAIAGAAVLGAALVLGLPETILGAAAGVVVYRILKSQEPRAEAPSASASR